MYQIKCFVRVLLSKQESSQNMNKSTAIPFNCPSSVAWTNEATSLNHLATPRRPLDCGGGCSSSGCGSPRKRASNNFASKSLPSKRGCTPSKCNEKKVVIRPEQLSKLSISLDKFQGSPVADADGDESQARLQPTQKRRRYMRRGSKCPLMLIKELQEGMRFEESDSSDKNDVDPTETLPWQNQVLDFINLDHSG